YRVVETRLPRLPQFSPVMRTGYDLVGNAVFQTDANGVNRTRYDYDRVYRVTRLTDPLGNAIAYAYDPGGNMVVETHTSPGSPRPTYVLSYDTNAIPADAVSSYDAMNRPTRKDEAVVLGDPTDPHTPTVHYVTTYQYDDRSNRTTVTNPRG